MHREEACLVLSGGLAQKGTDTMLACHHPSPPVPASRDPWGSRPGRASLT